MRDRCWPFCCCALSRFSTNIFYYHRFSLAPVSPAGSPLGHWMVVVPVIGGLIVGLMARFGSDKIRGHGIPEAIEAILLHRAKVASEDRHPETHLRSHRNRIGWSVRRRRSHHHDRRSRGFADRSVDARHRCRKNHTARRRCGSGYVRHLCHARGSDSARGRTPALRMAPAKPGPCSDRQCHGGASPGLLAWRRAALSHARGHGNSTVLPSRSEPYFWVPSSDSSPPA